MVHTNNNTTYYINPSYLSFTENSGYGANYIQASASSSCYIRVFIPGLIGYDGDGNYRRWKITAYNNKFPDNGAFHIYVRLEKNSPEGLVVYSKNLYNADGSLEDGSVNPGDEYYYYIRIGDVSSTNGTSIREISYDTGRLESDQVKNEGTLLNEMWELDRYSTPWLIRAKQWLDSFTVKGFITLIGGLVFKKGEEEKPVTDIKRSIDNEEEYLIDEDGNVLTDEDGDPVPNPDFVPVSDYTLPTTKWVLDQNNDRYLKKYEPDETEHRIKFHDGIECGEYVEGALTAFGGRGTFFDGNGYGEMTGLRLREFLEVPELRFNRVEVVNGILWNSVAFGLVESVNTQEQICVLKLEEGERSGLQKDDICMGMFCNFGDGSSDGEGDDDNGFPKMYGFSTSYFTPTVIIENAEGRFSFYYSLQPGTTVHPCESMKFAVYGNFFDKSRQASAYSTRTYKRYLKGVDTWKIDPDRNIYAQYGDLNGLSIGGNSMSGYGSFQDNVFIKGGVFEFSPQQKEELKGEDAYSASLSSYVGVVRRTETGELVAGEYEAMNVISSGENVTTDGRNVVTDGTGYFLKTLIQVFRGTSELLFSNEMREGVYTAYISPVGCSAELINGSVFVTGINEGADYAHVGIDVNCEGNASFHLTYEIKIAADGVGGFVSMVFLRSNQTPSVPVGGTYGNPIPDPVLSGAEWYDSIPSGQEQVWSSRCRFLSDGNYPQDASWSEPSLLTDTADFEVIYSELENPQAPLPKTDDKDWTPSEGWLDDSTPQCIWMATSVKHNGVWGEWDVLKFKGEKGDGNLSVQCSSYTVTRNSLGAIDPSSVLVKAVRGNVPAKVHLYMFARKTVQTDSGSGYEYVRLSMDGYNTYDSAWDINLSALSDDSYRAVVFAVSNDPVASPEYPGEYDDEVMVNYVLDGENGQMPRNRGEYDNDTAYEYGEEYRDFAWLNDNGTPKVFMRKNKGSTNIGMRGFVKGVSPISTDGPLYWEETSRQSLMAIDTALIDGAWIGGFMIRNGRMESQNEGDPKLVLDGGSGFFKCVDAEVDGDIRAGSVSYKVLHAIGETYDLTGYGMVIGFGTFLLPEVKDKYSLEIKILSPSLSRSVVMSELKSVDGTPIRISTENFYGKDVESYEFSNNNTLYSVILVYEYPEADPYWVINSSIRGSEGGGISLYVDSKIDPESENPVQNKVIYDRFVETEKKINENKIVFTKGIPSEWEQNVLYIIE